MVGRGQKSEVEIETNPYVNSNLDPKAVDNKVVFGIGYNHRFFTDYKWNLLVGSEIIDKTFGLNIGFAYSW